MGEKILITGRAGSGKTRSVLDRAAEILRRRREEECLLLLPTQSQVDHVKGLLLRETRSGFRDLFAHTFFTFSRMLFRGLPENLLSEEGRDYLLKDLLGAGDLPAFRKVRDFAGFRALLGEAIRELKDNGVTPRDYRRRVLDPLGGEGGAPARHRDLGKAFAAYERLLEELGKRDREDLFLEVLARLEAEPGLMADRTLLLVDGFHDFTPVQFRILERLSRRIPESVFTLSFDPDRPDQPPFRVSGETRDALLRLGFRERTLRENRRTEDPTLLRLERDLFAGGDGKGEAGESLLLIQAARREEELEAIARSILRLVREEGVAWREIAVLFHDPAEVSELLEGTFRRFGIPVRILEARPLDRQPVVRFLLDLGSLIFGPLDAGRLLRLLRSGYVAGLSPAEVDLLDARLRVEGEPADPAEWRAATRRHRLPGAGKVLRVILGSRRKAGGRPDARRAGTIWREAFRELALPGGSPEGDGADALGASGPRGPVECAAVEAFWRVADEASLRRGGGGDGGSAAAFLRDVEEETRQAGFRVRDRRRETVHVIGAREARQWEVPCLFVGGVLERQFPPLPVEGLLFDDRDRHRLSRAGLHFPDRAWFQEEERFLFYTAVTRARERLILSYPAADDRGNPTLPSFFLSEIRQVFEPESLERRTRRRPAAPLALPGEAAGLDDADRAIFAGLERRIGPDGEEGSALVAALYNRRREDPEFRRRLDFLLERRPPRLRDPGILGEIAGANVALSNSSLTSFLQCPYLHFVEKWLRLDPLPERDLSPLDLGNALHAALSDYFRAQGDADPLDLLDRSFAEIAAGKRRSFRRVSDFWRLRRALADFLPGEVRRNREMGLTPALLESSFGLGEAGRPALTLEVGGRRESFSGKIDRVDLLPSADAAVVVDYKYSAGETVRAQLRASAGEAISNFQLALYLLALRDVLAREPAGAELVALKKKVERRGIGRREVLERAGLAGSLGRDWELLDEGEFQAFLQRAKEAMGNLAVRIRSGEIDTRPADLSACGPGDCDAADICRYDRWLGGKGRED